MNGADIPRDDPALAREPMMDTAEAARAVGGRLAGAAVPFSAVNTDTRSLAPGDLFVALAGERFDGHDYLAEARARGAAAAMVARALPGEALPQVVVDDTRLALGRLAAGWRARFDLPLAALTGSNGKTTVKEMLSAILAAHCDPASPGEGRAAVLATVGNLNNDIGMPLTLLGLRARHRFAVIEMGMNHEGEIDYLTRLARPTVALVNNAQRAHVGILGSLEAIARAKGEIYAGLGSGGVAIVNEDDAFAGYWKKLNTGRDVLTFGFAAGASVRAERAGESWRFATPAGAFEVRLRVAGEHNVANALAACAAAHALGAAPAAMRAGLAGFEGVPGRLQRRRGIEGASIVDDSYNANPESMKAAIRVLAAEPGRRVFVMGDMGELGAAAEAMHAEVGAFARECGIERLLALGPASERAAQAFGEGAAYFEDADALVAEAAREARPGVTVLVKGSRFMRMERVADALSEGGGDAA